MAVYQTERILEDVRTSIDRNMTSTALAGIGDVDTLAIDGIIRSKIEEGVRRVHATAPAFLLEGADDLRDSIHWERGCSGWTLLPSDFLRLVVFQMSDWERPVYTAGDPDDAGYLHQSSRFAGIRGTAQKPKCYLSIRPEGRALEFYSCKSEDAVIAKGKYMPDAVTDDAGGIEISGRCHDAAVYTIASLTLAALGDTERSEALAALARAALV